MRLVRFIKNLYKRVEITLENHVILTLYITIICYIIYIITYKNFIILLLGIFLAIKLYRAVSLTLKRERKLKKIRRKISNAKIVYIAERREKRKQREHMRLIESITGRPKYEAKHYGVVNAAKKENESKGNIIQFPSEFERRKN